MKLDDVKAGIADLSHPEVLVTAKAQGNVAGMLELIRHSALAALLDHSLDESKGSGNAQLGLQLQLPIEHMERSKVRGSLAMTDGGFQLMPEIPDLRQVRGTLAFTDTGFDLAGIKARALGGEVVLEGGLKLGDSKSLSASALNIAVQGSATAQGLRESPALEPYRFLAEHLQGQAEYGVQVRMRRGQPEVEVQSSFQGMAVTLPEPFGKPASVTLPVRYSQQLLPSSLASATAPVHDQLLLQWGPNLDVRYERDLANQGKVLRGLIRLGAGGNSPGAVPEKGVLAHVGLAHLDLDPWLGLLPEKPADAGARSAAGSVGRSYIPDRLTLEVGSLGVKSRLLHEVSLITTRTGRAWQSRIAARELTGYIEYQEGGEQEPAGQIIARLSHLNIPKAAEASVDAWLSDTDTVQQLPALQITAENTRIGDMALGRLEVQASNRLIAQPVPQREWQLSRFNISNPDASLAGQGKWVVPIAPGSPAGKTQLKFELALNDAGRLLNRLGMQDVVASGKGAMQGEVGWSGAPVAPDFRSMSGELHLDVRSGRFLKADPGLAKLLGVLSLQALPRRLLFDFRDVFRDGFSFDFMRGDVQVHAGVARTNNMQMKGVNAAVLMEGSANIDKETQNLHVVIVPELNAMTASLVATAINPVVGLGSFLAQFFLRGPLNAALTKEFNIDGSWSDPQVTEVKRGAARAGTSAPDRSEAGAEAVDPKEMP